VLQSVSLVLHCLATYSAWISSDARIRPEISGLRIIFARKSAMVASSDTGPKAPGMVALRNPMGLSTRQGHDKTSESTVAKRFRR
jgi:hypothetical protein